ncbi:MAG TPA: lyase family protein [Xanthobacteraceae bacterium]
MTNPLAPSLLLPPLVSSAAMRAIVEDRARLQRMLDFEAALVRAEAAVGVVPASAVDPIAAACRAEHYDLAALAEAAAATGNLVVPLVKALTAEVAKNDAQAASCVHWGAAGQDVVDTALVLELRAAIDALIGDLNRAIEAFTALAGRQRRTASVARMSLRHALPMPFGLKVAGYAAALGRARERLKRLRRDALMLQFGGTAGTLAALGDQGLDVTDRLAALLDLPAPEAPWHSHRDRLMEVAAAFGILAGTCGKIGRDMALLMQNEVAEVFEQPAPSPPGGDGAAATPPNPDIRAKLAPGAAATMAVTAAMIAPALVGAILACAVQEHERAAGAWQAEWTTFPALLLVTSGALGAVADLAQGIEVDPDRMRANVDTTHGLIMAEAIAFALSGKISRQEAQKILEEATRKAVAEKRSLQNVLNDDAQVTTHLSGPTLARLFEPMSYQGAAQTFIDRLIGSLRAGTGKRA